jgi:hypothetical protein
MVISKKLRKIYWQSKCSTVMIVNLVTLGLLRKD